MILITLIQLIILFVVIFDPLASLSVFIAASKHMKHSERNKMATLSLLVATGLSFLVIMLGENLLNLFSTNLDEFKIAGGIILGILGIEMTLGASQSGESMLKKNSAKAVAAIIGTPLLTGPATITAIIVSINDYGRILTTLAVSIVLGITALLFFLSDKMNKIMGSTTVQVLSTVLGLITVAWGVKFVTAGIKAIFFGMG